VLELLLAISEYQVDLPGGKYPSQHEGDRVLCIPAFVPPLCVSGQNIKYAACLLQIWFTMNVYHEI